MSRDPRVDEYISKAAPFAKPILDHLRELVHKANPEVVETIKWGMPSFDYKGPYCSMAAFKKHVVFGFWKYQLIKDPKKYLSNNSANGGEAMGSMGRIESFDDMPPDKAIIDFVKQAKKLNDDGVKLPSKEKKPAKPLKIPTEFGKWLSGNRKAKEVFDQFSTSAKNEYIQWITEAKTEKTRLLRLETAIKWIAEGKRRNWKYEK